MSSGERRSSCANVPDRGGTGGPPVVASQPPRVPYIGTGQPPAEYRSQAFLESVRLFSNFALGLKLRVADRDAAARAD